MSVSLKVANVWRVLRDVNLDAIQASARHRFLIPVVADALDDAGGVRMLLSGDASPDGHPWLLAVRALDGMPPLALKPWLAILVSRQDELSPALAAVRSQLARDGVDVVTVIIGPQPSPSIPRLEERERVCAPAIDSGLARELASAIARIADPDRRIALARNLSPVRRVVVGAIIEETARANASFAMASGLAEVVPVLNIPMNLGDMVVLTKNQLVMSYRIALACGLEGEPRTLIPEILGVLGGGLLFRQIARQLVGLIPIFGLVPKVSIAYGGTYAIGSAVAGWATEGRAVSSDALQRFSREGLERGRQVARSLVGNAKALRATAHRRRAYREQVPPIRPDDRGA